MKTIYQITYLIRNYYQQPYRTYETQQQTKTPYEEIDKGLE